VSKNYDLLRQEEREEPIFATPSAPPQNRNVKDQSSDEILKLIQRTFLNGSPSAPRFVVFTGIERGSGCSWISSHAAEALASHGEGTVCLVERLGLVNAMLQPGPVGNFAQPIKGGALSVIAGSRLPKVISGVMSPERLKERFTELILEFNYVLVDAPPVNNGVEAMMLGQIADGVVLVLEANSTRRESARRAKESLESAGVKVLGAVLNKRTFPIPTAFYNNF
jgi:hypothetical protein